MDRFIFDLTKLLFYVLSLLTIILANTVFVLSILTAKRVAFSNHQKYAPEKSNIISDFYFLISICIGSSILVVLISLYGIHAVYFELKISLSIHGILLLLIHSCSLIMGSILFFDERKIGAPATLFFKVEYLFLKILYIQLFLRRFRHIMIMHY